jgi:RimJ/RimL family protein N-acetyltransferase
MHLRPATSDDAELLLAWRNDPITCKASRSTHTISPEEHKKWLTKTLQTGLLFIAEEDNTPVGCVRADKTARGTELSWTVAPDARGKGYGKIMCQKFVQEVIPNEPIMATIEEGNRASERIAEALGLKKTTLETPNGGRLFMIWKQQIGD